MSFGVSIGDIIKLCEVASRVYKNCRDSPGEYKSLTAEARSLTNALEDLSDKFESIPITKKDQFLSVYEPCVEILQELDKILLHYSSLDTKSKRAWDRLKWDSERNRALRERLTSSVVMLNGFYTSLVHDNQVLILEALGRLEQDYRGGHREESISSVEQIASSSTENAGLEAEDAAWSQITRDLEDVEVTAQDALDYRDFIVDWFIRAVNEGRLMEGHTDPDAFLSMRSLGDTLPTTTAPNALETPRFSPRAQPETVSLQTSSITNGLINEPEFASSIGVLHFPSSSTLVQSLIATSPGTSNIEESILVSSHNRSQPEVSTKDDLLTTARLIVDAWQRRDFVCAEKLLERQLVAVERGATITINDNPKQPDRRLLRHLIGVCASYSGNYCKAKQLFESVFNGLYLSGANIDEGDIAAARWLGDTCLHLHEFQNAALAWAVAFDGLVSKYGTTRVLTQQVHDELHLLDYRLSSLQTLDNLFIQNIDISTIFVNTHAMEKLTLVKAVRSRMTKMRPDIIKGYGLSMNGRTMMDAKVYRSHTDWKIAEGFLLQPVASMSSWPLQWDPTFSPVAAIHLHCHMTEHLEQGFLYSSVPSINAIKAKNLHFVTRRSIKWLVEIVQKGLRERGIEYKENGAMILCRLEQHRDNFAFVEGIGIKFKKLQFLNMHGLKITGVILATRRIPSIGNSFVPLQSLNGTEEFKNVVTGFLEKAEKETMMADLKMRGETDSKICKTNQSSSARKREKA